jgi:hypothetical protein
MDKSSSNTENFQVIEDCTHQHLAIISSCTSFSNLLKLWCFISFKPQTSIRDIFTVTKLVLQLSRKSKDSLFPEFICFHAPGHAMHNFFLSLVIYTLLNSVRATYSAFCCCFPLITFLL